jgi:hypothetical protein
MNSDRETTPWTDDSVRRIAAGLRTALRLVGLSNRFCERELGLSTGYLTRILAGQVELRVSLVFNLCRLMELPPSAFFASVLPPPQLSEKADRVLRGLSAVHSQPSSPGNLDAVLPQLRDVVRTLEGLASPPR